MKNGPSFITRSGQLLSSVTVSQIVRDRGKIVKRTVGSKNHALLLSPAFAMRVEKKETPATTTADKATHAKPKRLEISDPI